MAMFIAGCQKNHLDIINWSFIAGDIRRARKKYTIIIAPDLESREFSYWKI